MTVALLAVINGLAGLALVALLGVVMSRAAGLSPRASMPITPSSTTVRSSITIARPLRPPVLEPQADVNLGAV